MAKITEMRQNSPLLRVYNFCYRAPLPSKTPPYRSYSQWDLPELYMTIGMQIEGLSCAPNAS